MTPTLASGSIARPRSAFRALVTGYVALLPYQFDTGDRMNFAPADVLLILALVLGVGHLKYRKTAWTVWHFGIALVFITGSLVAALRFGGLERYELLNKAAGLVLPFVSYFVITSAVSEWNDIRRILRVFAVSVVLENILAVSGFLAAYFFGVANPFARYGGLRLSGALLDPNAYGGLLVAALVICEGASWGRVPLLKGPALWICRITLTLGILFTFSRSAWVALGLALLLVCVIRAKTAIPLALTVLIGAPCLLLFMGQRFMPIFEVMASRPQQVQGRFELIRAALEAFTRHPILGGGLGSVILQALGASTGAGGLDIGSIISSVLSGGVGGGILMTVIGLLKGVAKA